MKIYTDLEIRDYTIDLINQSPDVLPSQKEMAAEYMKSMIDDHGRVTGYGEQMNWGHVGDVGDTMYHLRLAHDLKYLFRWNDFWEVVGPSVIDHPGSMRITNYIVIPREDGIEADGLYLKPMLIPWESLETVMAGWDTAPSKQKGRIDAQMNSIIRKVKKSDLLGHIKDTAIEGLIKIRDDKEYRSGIAFRMGQTRLIEAFTWEKTQEGHNFWLDVEWHTSDVKDVTSHGTPAKWKDVTVRDHNVECISEDGVHIGCQILPWEGLKALMAVRKKMLADQRAERRKNGEGL